MAQIKCPALNCHHGIVTNVYDHEGACKVCNGTGHLEGEETKFEFKPAFDMPATREQALECLKKWGDPLCATFDAARAQRMWELLKEPTPEAVRKLVEALEDAKNYVEAVVINSSPGKKQNNYMGCLSRIEATLDAVRGGV